MKKINDYFLIKKQKTEIKYKISLCGKLEAMIGNYFLSGAGNPDDDFMNDENIEFDFEAFDIIDSNIKYVNPKHFSVLDLINAL